MWVEGWLARVGCPELMLSDELHGGGRHGLECCSQWVGRRDGHGRVWFHPKEGRLLCSELGLSVLCGCGCCQACLQRQHENAAAGWGLASHWLLVGVRVMRH